MSIKDILVHVENEEAAAIRIAVAARLADTHGTGSGRLTGFHARPDASLPVLAQSFAGQGLTEAIRQAADGVAAQAETLFRRHAGGIGPELRWVDAKGDLDEQLAAAARYCDLAVIGQPGDEPRTVVRRPSALLSAGLSAGVPVLVVPPSLPDAGVGKRALIAWNGSRESVRAVHQSLPLLRLAETVEVVVVIAGPLDPAMEPPGHRLLDHLARHGVAATAKPLQLEDMHGVSGAILARVAATGADLVVMGAFGRSRLREAVIGSTTTTLLARSSVALFVAS